MSYNKELKPGIQALVIGCRVETVNVGKVVSIKRYAKAGELNPSGLHYVEDYWVCTGDNLVSISGTQKVVGSEGLFNPKHLMPIYPEADPSLSLEIKEKENV